MASLYAGDFLAPGGATRAAYIVAPSSQPPLIFSTRLLPMAEAKVTSRGTPIKSAGHPMEAAASLTSLLVAIGSASIGKSSDCGDFPKLASVVSVASVSDA